MEDIAIKIEGIGKKYSVGKEKDGSLRGTLNKLFKKNTTSDEDFWALKNVSFEVKKGEAIGIIGKNGAGKSTLLKILSQITKPTEGVIEINGRVASLLEVGTGFHPELTGRENIFLNGTILGMSRKEVKAKFHEIVEFSGVEKFIDTPVKHYSSGMYVRLAFAVAAHLEPEILIIDEVLAVGDAEFQKKCLGKMEDIANQGRTVLFVSHNMGAIKSLCTGAVLIENGRITKQKSKVEDIISTYLNPAYFSNDINKRQDRSGRNQIMFTKIDLLSDLGASNLSNDTPIKIKLSCKSDKYMGIERINLSINSQEHGTILYLNSNNDKSFVRVKKQIQNILVSIDKNFHLSPGAYYVNVALYSYNGLEDYISHALNFNVIGGAKHGGKIFGKSICVTTEKWSHENE